MSADTFAKMMSWIADFLANIVALFKELKEMLSNAAEGVM